MGVIDDAFTSLFFGTGMYFGLLLFIGISMGLILKWKPVAIIIVPIIFMFEAEYYDRYYAAYDQSFIWPMVTMLFYTLFIGLYAIFGKQKG